jgi:GNAT superfamily N-acetyltransferase
LIAERRAGQVRDNLAAYIRLFADVRGVRLVDEDVTWIVTEAGAPGNLLVRSGFTEATADRRIDEVVEAIGRHADDFDWLVFPGCRPGDLAERIAARGAAGGPDGGWELIGDVGGPGGAWMTADLTAPSCASPRPSPAARFQVERVTSPAMLEAWRAASAAGFGAGEGHAFYEAYARSGFRADSPALHFVGFLEGQPATSGTLLLAGDCAGIYDVSTPVAYRRRGFGAALTHAMMCAARDRGHAWAWLQSSQMGRRVYAALGFAEIDLGVREYRWRRKAAATRDVTFGP